MIRPIVIYPEPVLRQRGARVEGVDEELRVLADDMLETMRAARGVGLAAQQVGVARQIAVVDVAHAPESTGLFRVDGVEAELAAWMPLVFINPKVEALGGREGREEGCLSFPEVQGVVQRQAQVRAELELLDGRQIVVEADGLLARAIQHEVDHLNGMLFVDRMSPAAKIRVKKQVKRLEGGSWLPELEEDEEGEEGSVVGG